MIVGRNYYKMVGWAGTDDGSDSSEAPGAGD